MAVRLVILLLSASLCQAYYNFLDDIKQQNLPTARCIQKTQLQQSLCSAYLPYSSMALLGDHTVSSIESALKNANFPSFLETIKAHEPCTGVLTKFICMQAYPFCYDTKIPAFPCSSFCTEMTTVCLDVAIKLGIRSYLPVCNEGMLMVNAPYPTSQCMSKDGNLVQKDATMTTTTTTTTSTTTLVQKPTTLSIQSRPTTTTTKALGVSATTKTLSNPNAEATIDSIDNKNPTFNLSKLPVAGFMLDNQTLTKNCPFPLIFSANFEAGMSCRDQCCLGCPRLNMLYPSGQFASYNLYSQVYKYFAIVANIFLVLTYTILPGKRQYPTSLLSNMFIAMLLSSLPYAFTLGGLEKIQCVNKMTQSLQSTNALCAAQAALTHFGLLSTTFWLFFLSLNLFFSTASKTPTMPISPTSPTTFSTSFWLAERPLILHAISWGVPFIFNLATFLVKGYSYESFGTCRLSPQYMLPLFLIPFAIVGGITTSLLVTTFVIIFRMTWAGRAAVLASQQNARSSVTMRAARQSRASTDEYYRQSHRSLDQMSISSYGSSSRLHIPTGHSIDDIRQQLRQSTDMDRLEESHNSAAVIMARHIFKLQWRLMLLIFTFLLCFFYITVYYSITLKPLESLDYPNTEWTRTWQTCLIQSSQTECFDKIASMHMPLFSSLAFYDILYYTLPIVCLFIFCLTNKTILQEWKNLLLIKVWNRLVGEKSVQIPTENMQTAHRPRGVQRTQGQRNTRVRNTLVNLEI